MPPSRRRFLQLATVSGIALAGCTGGDTNGDGGTTTPTATPPSTAEPATMVSMLNTSFDPVRASVDPGATVEWVNEDGFAHDVTAAQFHEVAADWQLSSDVPAGERTSHTFESAGVYEYSCTIHGKGGMCGAVLVGDASLDDSLPCEGSDSDDGGVSYSIAGSRRR